MSAILGILCLYLAGINTVLVLSVGTCTQGGADELMGVILSIPLFAAGLALLAYARPRRWILLLLLPLALPLWMQLSFAVRLAYGYGIKGKSACDALWQSQGGPLYEMDGSEPLYLALWTLSNLIALGGFTFAFVRART